jgi:hypothetical protein
MNSFCPQRALERETRHVTDKLSPLGTGTMTCGDGACAKSFCWTNFNWLKYQKLELKSKLHVKEVVCHKFFSIPFFFISLFNSSVTLSKLVTFSEILFLHPENIFHIFYKVAGTQVDHTLGPAPQWTVVAKWIALSQRDSSLILNDIDSWYLIHMKH